MACCSRCCLLAAALCLRPQGAKIFGDGVWFKTNASALTSEGANILGFGFGFGNNLPFLFVSTVRSAAGQRLWLCYKLHNMRAMWQASRSPHKFSAASPTNPSELSNRLCHFMNHHADVACATVQADQLCALTLLTAPQTCPCHSMHQLYAPCICSHMPSDLHCVMLLLCVLQHCSVSCSASQLNLLAAWRCNRRDAFGQCAICYRH